VKPLRGREGKAKEGDGKGKETNEGKEREGSKEGYSLVCFVGSESLTSARLM
jgi:hypothetical protein